ncbi:uncharacterized protein EV422DRAFT_307933 [Fimicolochytrium jonesii]|uniref:uncharacterized protein n=1 Tax=Fimicolochytrium jonesii TaxID=1396493 RepID=UPI0022FEB18A|nr:uncharacterized protein EV422DRAFT_307933 [Fimicolochytrium jonesii]KAI8824137.1 hypothetical protein EV422DRAFT_307933 [Fimicolochytrium jonesii]
MLAPSTLKHDATAAARAAEADEQHGGEDAVTTERPRKHDISSLRARGSVSNSPFRSLMLKGSSGTWKEEVSNVKPPNPKLVDPQPPWKDSKPKALDMERCRAASATPYTSSSTSSAKHSPRLKDFKNGSVRGNPFVLADRGTGGKTGETMKAEPSHLRDWRSRSSSALPENSSAASTPPPVPHTISDTRQRNRLSLPDMWKGKTTEGNETPKAPEVVPGLSSSEGFWPIRKDSFGVAVGAKYLESVNAKKKSGSSRRSLDVAMFKPPDETEIGSKGAGVEEPVPLRLGSDETETVPTESNVEIPNSISIAGDQTSAEVESSSHLAADASSLASPDVSNDAPDRAPDAASVEDVTLVSTSTPPEMSADIEQKDHLLDSSPDEAAETFPVVADEDTSKVGTAADDNRHEAGVSKLGRVPSSAKQAFKRIWSPTRLQVPSVSAIFDDPDWLHAILGSNKSAAANATSPVTPTTSPTSAIAEASPRTSLSTMVPAVNLPPPPNTPPSIVRPPTPPLTSHQPMPPPDTVFPPPAAMTSGSDGTQQTPKGSGLKI